MRSLQCVHVLRYIDVVRSFALLCRCMPIKLVFMNVWFCETRVRVVYLPCCTGCSKRVARLITYLCTYLHVVNKHRITSYNLLTQLKSRMNTLPPSLSLSLYIFSRQTVQSNPLSTNSYKRTLGLGLLLKAALRS